MCDAVKTKWYNNFWFHIGIIVFSIVADQLTKLWALARFTNETGAPNHEYINVVGEFIRFGLVFNKGAAFSSRPQDLLPFLPPVVFFILISVVAAVVLFIFYRASAIFLGLFFRKRQCLGCIQCGLGKVYLCFDYGGHHLCHPCFAADFDP